MFFYVRSYILGEHFRNDLSVASVEKEHEAIASGNALSILVDEWKTNLMSLAI